MLFIKKAGFVFLFFVLVLTELWQSQKTEILFYREDLIYYAQCHLFLVGWSMLISIVFGVSVGIMFSRKFCQNHANRLMQIFNIGNAVPTMAMLALALVVFGIGDIPAIVALVAASILPIIQNTYEGLRQVPQALTVAGYGIGMTSRQVLIHVEIPNSLKTIFGGIRTALAINVGTAPLSFIIGGDSLGGLIFPGIYLNNSSQLFLGAVATALIALGLDALVAFGSMLYFSKKGLA